MNSYNEQGNFDFLDVLAVLAFVVQLMDYDLTVKQSSNDDILKELRADMAELRREIAEIIHKLSEIH